MALSRALNAISLSRGTVAGRIELYCREKSRRRTWSAIATGVTSTSFVDSGLELFDDLLLPRPGGIERRCFGRERGGERHDCRHSPTS